MKTETKQTYLTDKEIQTLDRQTMVTLIGPSVRNLEQKTDAEIREIMAQVAVQSV